MSVNPRGNPEAKTTEPATDAIKISASDETKPRIGGKGFMKAGAEKPGEARDTEDYQKIFNRKWDRHVPSEIELDAPQMAQIRRLLQPALAQYFGGGHHTYTLGFFLGGELKDKETLGYHKLTTMDFPSGTFNEAKANAMNLSVEADHSLRWGSRRELFVCCIRDDVRRQVRDRINALAEKQLNKTLPEGKRVVREDMDYDSTDRSIGLTEEEVEFEEEKLFSSSVNKDT